MSAATSLQIGDLISALKREVYKHRRLAAKARRRAECDPSPYNSYFARLAVAYDAAAAAFEAELSMALAKATSMRRIDAPDREAKP